jgi:type VI secretion system protein ImpH
MSRAPQSVLDRLFREGHAFDFFQAVRLLGLWQPDRVLVGQVGAPAEEIVRFHAHLSLSFPASEVFEILEPAVSGGVPQMTVTFMGLTGPSGVLPVHYTELLLWPERLRREILPDERNALRDWLDLFNHRLVSLFYRAWEKYRLFPAYERQMRLPVVEGAQAGQGTAGADSLTQVLLNLVGLGTPALTERLRVVQRPTETTSSRLLASIDDLALLYYSGLLAQRPRNALALQTLVQDYFGLPVRVLQFQGQWLRLPLSSQSSMKGDGGNNALGKDLVVGERVWDVQSKIRLRLGPLGGDQFREFIPDRAPPAVGCSLPRGADSSRGVCEEWANRRDERGATEGLRGASDSLQGDRRRFGTFFLLVHLVRLYLGPELDFDVQLVLQARDVPPTRLDADGVPGSRLGWDTWLLSLPAAEDADDAVFRGEEVFELP